MKKSEFMKMRYVAYDAANGDYMEFQTRQAAEDWLTQDDGDGISSEAVDGLNYIAEIQYRSKVTPVDFKKDYHVHTDDCPDDCDEEEWPYDSDWDYIASHTYERINWNETTN